MQDMTEYIRNRIEKYEQRSKNWEEKVNALTEYMKNAETDGDIHRLELERQKCIGKQNELLAVSDFCNGLLREYFS